MSATENKVLNISVLNLHKYNKKQEANPLPVFSVLLVDVNYIYFRMVKQPKREFCVSEPS